MQWGMFGLAVMVAAALSADAVTSLEIRGETTCPDPAGVRKQLEPLTPRPWPSEAAVKLVVLAAPSDAGGQGGDVVVTLFGPTLELLEERRLARYPSCDERARAAAIVIAAWLTALPAGAPPTMGLAASPPLTVGRVAPPVSSGRPLQLRAAAAALAALSSEGGVAPGLWAEVAAAPRGARWSLSLAGLLHGTHRKPLGDGQATWWRWGAGAGGAWRAVPGEAWLDLHGAVLATRLGIAGAGFTNNAGGTTWDVGATVGARLGYRWSLVQPWLGAWVVGWGGTQDIHIAGAAPRGEIPRVDAMLGLGATFGAANETF